MHLLFANTICTILLLNIVQLTSGFKCYVCDSKIDNECVENLPKNSKLQPQECKDLIEPKYCIKTTNMYAGELGTKRFCAANDHGTYCQYVKQPTGDREHRSCVYTCSSENCNGAPGSIGLTSATIYLAIISIAINNYLASSTSTRNII